MRGNGIKIIIAHVLILCLSLTTLTSCNSVNQSDMRSSINDDKGAVISSNGNQLLGRFLGGGGDEGSWSIAIDSMDNILVTGQTDSSDFPTSTGAYDTSFNGGYKDAFVAKIDKNFELVWGTYLGGSSTDLGLGIDVDSENNVVVIGRTDSSNFPTLNALDDSFNGLTDGFISKFSPDGDLLWSSFHGGSDLDFGHKIQVDLEDNIVTVGETSSTDFPITSNAHSSTLAGGVNSDGFISKFSEDGSELLLSSYLGGNDSDSIRGLGLTIHDHAFVTGRTESNNFPTVEAFDDTLNGYSDIFVSLFNMTSGYLLFSTYIGGSNDDGGRGIVADDVYNFHVTGDTWSNDFPVQNAHDDTYGGSGLTAGDAFVLKANQSSIIWSTYLSGSGNNEDTGRSIVLDSHDNVIVTGWTESQDFPTLNAFYPDYYNERDVFVSKFFDSGTLSWSTFIGGNLSDYGYSIIVDEQDDVIVAGLTYSPDFPITLNEHAGEADAFIVTFSGLGPATTTTTLGRCILGEFWIICLEWLLVPVAVVLIGVIYIIKKKK